MSEHRHHEHPASHHLVFDTAAMATFAELEGEVLAGLLTEATSMVAELCRRQGVEVRRVVDIGCGPGVGSCALARQFGSAGIVAVDGAAAMLEHARTRAERLGLESRIETRQVELPAGLGTLDRADVIWASMVLHHLGDETVALRQIGELLEPGGLLAVVERIDPVRVLPDDTAVGRPGLWARFDAAWAAWFTAMRTDLPGATPSADYPTMFEAAGLELVADEVLTLVLGAPLDSRARRFAHQQLRRMRAQLESHAGADDLDVLDRLIDEHSDEGILRRTDALLRTSRQLYVARVASET